MNIALVADWLPVFGGAEHVIAEFTRLWPQAPLYTTVAKRGGIGPLDNADIRTSRLQKWYRLVKNHQILLPWMPSVMEGMDLSKYKVILSSSHAVGKGLIPPSTAVHVCYCHTPMRYAWEMEEEYLDDFGIPSFFKPKVRKMLKELRRWDLTTAKRVDVFIANSTTTQKRIRKTYNRDSVVVYPPVDERFLESPLRDTDRSYYLAVGRLVPYKRFDLLIEAANEMKLPLKIAGTGQDRERLKKMAGPTVEMLGFVPDADLPSLYAGAKALLFPQHEDAGVVPLEAQACGTPVIAFAKGGALDTVVHGTTGLHFLEQTVTGLRNAINEFESGRFDHRVIRDHASKFASSVFRSKIESIVQEAVA